MDETCTHPEFECRANVRRVVLENAITGELGKEPYCYTIDVKVRCRKCEMPFKFIGLSAGSHPSKPTVSFGGDELRSPIEPAPEAHRWELPIGYKGTA